jgi:hypothetical protein
MGYPAGGRLGGPIVVPEDHQNGPPRPDPSPLPKTVIRTPRSDGLGHFPFASRSAMKFGRAKAARYTSRLK